MPLLLHNPNAVTAISPHVNTPDRFGRTALYEVPKKYLKNDPNSTPEAEALFALYQACSRTVRVPNNEGVVAMLIEVPTSPSTSLSTNPNPNRLGVAITRSLILTLTRTGS